MQAATLLLSILTALLPAAQAAEQESSLARGVWDSQPAQGRARMGWEEPKGYRLFFHPKDKEPLRRVLTLALPTDRKITAAWAIVRPLRPELEYADAWLRVEGYIEGSLVRLEWDGNYRGRPFPDGPYLFDVHLRWKPDGEKNWKLVILKDQSYPRFSKLGAQVVDAHPLAFEDGEFQPVGEPLTLSRQATPLLPVIARVLAPRLDGSFSIAGIQVQGRLIENALGVPVEQPQWECLCQQALPQDSPARDKPKKVRCDWDLSQAETGVWDLRLGLYHDGQGPERSEEECDHPVLDEDRLRVLVTP